MDKKYNLSQDEKSLLRRRRLVNQDAIQLSGKPTTNLREFFRRLFSRKITVIALAVFIGVIITAIIITATSKFGPEGTILIWDDGEQVVPKNFLIALLPPTWQDGGDVETVLSGQQLSLLDSLTSQGMIIKTSEILGPDRFRVIFNPYEYFNNPAVVANGSGANFILGTNTNGQDNWTRIWAGTLESLKLALLVAVAETIIGVGIGAYLGFHAGSRIDNYLMRLIDAISIVPVLLWFILISYLLPQGFWTLFLALTAFGWIGPVYQTRMYILRVKNLDFIRAAKTVGVPKWKLIYKYGLPQSLGRILSQFVRRVPIVIFAQASLAFLGFSNADDFNLGAIINDAKSRLENIWYLLTPTFIIFAITLSLQFVANGINDALEPKVGV